MTRLHKILSVVGLSSVYLMQAPCTSIHGLSIIPNISLNNLLGGFGL
jgi:hypothetical protein